MAKYTYRRYATYELVWEVDVPDGITDPYDIEEYVEEYAMANDEDELRFDEFQDYSETEEHHEYNIWCHYGTIADMGDHETDDEEGCVIEFTFSNLEQAVQVADNEQLDFGYHIGRNDRPRWVELRVCDTFDDSIVYVKRLVKRFCKEDELTRTCEDFCKFYMKEA